MPNIELGEHGPAQSKFIELLRRYNMNKKALTNRHALIGALDPAASFEDMVDIIHNMRIFDRMEYQNSVINQLYTELPLDDKKLLKLLLHNNYDITSEKLGISRSKAYRRMQAINARLMPKYAAQMKIYDMIHGGVNEN